MISDNLIDIKRRIDSVLLEVGRKPESCTLIGVSKTKPVSQIKEAYRSGLRHFGENYVEEFFSKHYDYHPDDLHYHFIGRLPTKKVRKVVGKSSLIHSISSLKLAKKVDFVSKDENLIQKVLIQINQGDEASKSGFSLNVGDYFEDLLSLSNVNILGLMSIPPYSEPARPYFISLRELRDELEKQFDIELPYLSMGMSGDFEEAIREGSTHIRVGTSIFGER
ncbi:MAG: YggS family pyridoxal phosphate-dependent enzyme [Candidatus Thermoplasmatota archaeon]|nr:YggS family pyridoxal phosphate-dependent enzyme [Candidatus Thermoplasmatota archaeon]MEC7350129.1 YggS family pyridoxal phosphate-dependent enzyme [Candidatus Thermoplasmatota archaeon]MEC7976745.1 YggS family pyridoxal phosphate-dependent enzyme [Candidatus Thermoplasmatota archaeon]